MFGNKNAGLHENSMRLGLHRRQANAKKVRTSAEVPISRKGFEMLDQRETFFAVVRPIRWTL
jgi:hypothetical protein